MKIKLNSKQKNGVKHWLKMTFSFKLKACPFKVNSYISQKSKYCKICASWFPKVVTQEDNFNFIVFHPCDIYSLEWVIKRAMQMVK